jgi:DNA-binding transcriptional MocR family regulator
MNAPPRPVAVPTTPTPRRSIRWLSTLAAKIAPCIDATATAARSADNGIATRLEKRRRDDARDRQQIAHDALTGLRYLASPSSYYGWLRLPDNVRSDHIAHQLADGGILVSTAEAFCVTPHPPNALRLALGTPPLPELTKALDRLRQVVFDAAW